MHTVPMTRANLGPCAHLTTTTYGASPVFQHWLRPNPTSFPDHWARALAGRLKAFYVSEDHAARVMVSDDSDAFHDPENESGEILGYASWFRMRGTMGGAEERTADGKGSVLKWSRAPAMAPVEEFLLNCEMWYAGVLDADTAWDRAAFRLFKECLAKMRGKIAEVMVEVSAERGYIYLNDLHCTTARQRQGIGGRLLQQGLEQAKVENVPVCLLASEEGEGLYSRKGFETIGMAYFDKYKVPAMIWYPPTWRVKPIEYFVVDGNKVDAVVVGHDQ